MITKIIKFRTKEDKPMLNILDVARYLLSLGSMKHKKLQKICYYIQAWYLAFMGEPLIDTEFQAWAHGPVSPILYHAYKEWGGLTIPKITYKQYNLNISDNIKLFITTVYEIYNKYTADELESLTHKERPWIDARGNVPDGQPCTNVIPNDAIKEFYKGYITNDSNDTGNK